jgi:hypothetical protein
VTSPGPVKGCSHDRTVFVARGTQRGVMVATAQPADQPGEIAAAQALIADRPSKPNSDELHTARSSPRHFAATARQMGVARFSGLGEATKRLSRAGSRRMIDLPPRRTT